MMTHAEACAARLAIINAPGYIAGEPKALKARKVKRSARSCSVAPVTAQSIARELAHAVNGCHYGLDRYIVAFLDEIVAVADSKVRSIIESVEKYRRCSDAQAYCIAQVAISNSIKF